MGTHKQWELVCQECGKRWEREGDVDGFYLETYCEWCGSDAVRAVDPDPPRGGATNERA